MRKLLALSVAIFFFSVFAAVPFAEEWKLFDTPKWSFRFAGTDVTPENNKSPIGINNPLSKYSDSSGPALTMGQLKLSFIDIGPDANAPRRFSSNDPVPTFEFNSGIRSTSGMKTPGVFHSLDMESDLTDSAFILFFGVNLNVGPGYFKSNAFMANPQDNAVRPASPFQTAFPPERMMMDSNAKGFNAHAGYKLNDRVTLEAGYGYVEQDRAAGNTNEEAWAIYAQAILSLYPGVQVIPGIGQIDSDKNKPKNASAENFFAGAKWEINF